MHLELGAGAARTPVPRRSLAPGDKIAGLLTAPPEGGLKPGSAGAVRSPGIHARVAEDRFAYFVITTQPVCNGRPS
jgi:hypothetical protein